MSDNLNTRIWQLQTQVNIDGLIRALRHDNAAIRRRAAAALRVIGDTRAITPLKSAFAAETNTNTREMIAAAIKAISGEEMVMPEEAPPDTVQSVQTTVKTTAISNGSAQDDVALSVDDDALDDTGALVVRRLEADQFDQILNELSSSDSDVVIQAARKLGEMGNKLAVERLVLLFQDHTNSIHVRLAVAEALIKLESAPVEVALLANLRHSDWRIRRNGAAILGQLKAEWAIQPLADAMRDPHKNVRRTASAALKHIGTPESRKALAMRDIDEDRKPIAPTTPGGNEIKPLNDKKRPPKSSLLSKHLDGEDEPEDDTPDVDQTIAARPDLGGTKPLNPDDLPPEMSDTEKLEQHRKATRPLDPSTLDEFEDHQTNNGDADDSSVDNTSETDDEDNS